MAHLRVFALIGGCFWASRALAEAKYGRFWAVGRLEPQRAWNGKNRPENGGNYEIREKHENGMKTGWEDILEPIRVIRG